MKKVYLSSLLIVMIMISSITCYAANGLNAWGMPLQLGYYKVDGEVYIDGSAYIYDSNYHSFFDLASGQTFYSDALDGSYDVYLYSYDQTSMTILRDGRVFSLLSDDGKTYYFAESNKYMGGFVTLLDGDGDEFSYYFQSPGIEEMMHYKFVG